MFYVTGDVHGDLKEFSGRAIKRPKKTDFAVICGDFGVLWEGGKAEEKELRKLGARKFPTLFVDGCHENFTLLNAYPEKEWNGGKVHILSGNLIHLMRGQVYTINGKKVFTFGGGESPDREMRAPGKSWWPEELPTPAEMEEGIRNLVAAGWEVDYIFTHAAPSSIKKVFVRDNAEPNPLNVYLDYINEKCKFKKWMFGSYHKNKKIASLHECVFDAVETLE